MANKGKRMLFEDEYNYLTELKENHSDPSAEWGGSGSEYTAGTGIVIEDDTISVDTEDVAMVSNLSTVAFSGSYNDLSNKPTIPTKTSDLDNDSGFITGIDSSDVISALGYTPGTSNFDGDYNSLTNKPTIPTVGDGVITVTQGGVTKGTFTVNQSGNTTIALDAGGGTPTNMVTTDTNQEITGRKEFKSGSFRTLVTGTGVYTSNPDNDIFRSNITEDGLSVTYKTGTNDSASISIDYDTLSYRTGSNVSELFQKFNIYVSNSTTNGAYYFYPTKKGDVAITSEIPTKVSDLNNDSGFITGITDTMVTNALGYTPGTSNFSGSYTDLTNKPTIPTATSDLTNDSGFITGITSTDVVNALGYTPGTSNFSGDYDDLTDKPTLATVATTGDYTDLTNKPTIPTYTAGTWIDITNDTINVSNPYVSLLDNNNIPRVMISDHTSSGQPSFSSAKYCNISPNGFGINDRSVQSSNQYTYYKHDEILYNNAYSLTLPAKTGTIAVTSDIITSYNDLTDKPTIPTVNNKTITIQKNGTTVDSFTLNQSTNKSINITVPTAVSDLTNDSGFITGITSSDVTTALGYTPGTSNFSGSYTDLTDKPSIPSTASSSVTASTATVVDGVTYTPATETLTFTYDDDTTATVTFLTSSTSVTSSTATVMTGATVTTTLS